jgi:hypothetical protein
MGKADTIDPIIVDETCWMYPQRNGLDVVIERRDPDGQLVSSVSHVIPWNKIERAISQRPKSK